MADILTTAIRKSMNGNLQKNGWKNFGKVIVMGERQSITLMSISEDVNLQKYKIKPSYHQVI